MLISSEEDHCRMMLVQTDYVAALSDLKIGLGLLGVTVRTVHRLKSTDYNPLSRLYF